jgi:hypothetical protein
MFVLSPLFENIQRKALILGKECTILENPELANGA